MAPLLLPLLCALLAQAAGSTLAAESSAAQHDGAKPPAPAWLRPAYHYTRAKNHMNDPNGLMYTTDSAGNVTYHMYFQSSDPGQTIGSIWG